MAHQSTVFAFDIDLSDVDRGIYQQLSISVARHPSETSVYMLSRVLAYCLEWREGIAFSRGLSESDEPAVWVKDPTGALVAWIEIGTPSAERLHRARKACAEVAVYCHKDPRIFLEETRSASIHQSASIRVVELPRDVLTQLEALLTKRMKLTISRSEDCLYLEAPDLSVSGPLVSHSLTNQTLST